MKVVVTNTVVLNTGDAAILLGLIHVVKLAFGDAVEITVLDSQPKAATKYYPQISFVQLETFDASRTRLSRAFSKVGFRRLLQWVGGRIVTSTRAAWAAPVAARNLAAYRSADMIISTGGTYLVERYGLVGRFAQLSLALASGRPVVLFTQSLGPFHDERYRRWLRAMLPRLSLILLRDEVSLNNLVALETPLPKALVVADAAFALADGELVSRASERTGAIREVAVSVRRWDYFAADSNANGMSTYVETIRRLITVLVERGAKVVLLSTCQGVPEYWTDDSETGELIADGLPSEVAGSVRVDRSHYSPGALMEKLKTFDLVVATRMHMAILALCAGTPVFPIAYESKTTELFSKLGLGEWVEQIESLDPTMTSGRLLAFLEALPGLRGPLFQRVIEERQSALGVVALLRQCAAGA